MNFTHPLSCSLQQGYPTSTGPTFGTQPDTSSLDFRPVPNRWLITRRFDKSKGNILPDTPATQAISVFESWVVESNRLRNINDDDIDENEDLEVNMTPFINPK